MTVGKLLKLFNLVLQVYKINVEKQFKYLKSSFLAVDLKFTLI